jgi:2-phosphosulfolactate phosphatase
MQIKQVLLAECADLEGTVVVIDVLRAFTTAAYAFHRGAREIYLVSSVEEALAMRDRLPNSLVMGEVDALPVPEFDLSNSPTEISTQDLNGLSLIQRTSAGTQGMVRSTRADLLLAAAFTCAEATVRTILPLHSEQVTFVLTGWRGKGWGEEDAACAEYMAERLQGRDPDPAPYLRRVLDSAPGRLFADPTRPEFPASDLDYCLAIDRFDFAMIAQRQGEDLILRKSAVEGTSGRSS